MFYKQRIDTIADKVIDMDTDIKTLKNAVSKNIEDINELTEKIKYLYESNESYEKCIKELQINTEALDQMDKGLLEALKGDRRDLNAIINIIKKLQTKGKK